MGEQILRFVVPKGLMAEGFAAKEERKESSLLYLARHVEAFERAKKLPKLETLMKKRKPKAK